LTCGERSRSQIIQGRSALAAALSKHFSGAKAHCAGQGARLAAAVRKFSETPKKVRGFYEKYSKPS